eukprot:CAMPEP_0197865040 /NCGR_PEP_ID=MMETSP1438-20131217/43432_1 /TAXON_ID=1461541 /ORGANISM="Pterosperma sp., Strain CCMP1384" /LENGTH=528 /DNA_ID=CAMNT_0043483443 /DNA_START=3294 /DNA_END=4876 /DNA_ORIENTATION=-
MVANTNPLSDGWNPTQYSVRNLMDHLNEINGPEWTLERAALVIDQLMLRLQTIKNTLPWQLTIVWPRRNDGTLIGDDDPSFGEEIYVPIELWVTQGTSHTDWIQQLCVHPWFGDNLNQTYGEPLANVVGALSVSDSVLALNNHAIDGKGVRIVGVRIVGTSHTPYSLDPHQQVFGRSVREWQRTINPLVTSIQPPHPEYPLQIPTTSMGTAAQPAPTVPHMNLQHQFDATTTTGPNEQMAQLGLNTYAQLIEFSQLEAPTVSQVATTNHQFEMFAATQGTTYVPTTQGTSYVPDTQGIPYVPVTRQGIPHVPASTQVIHHVLPVPPVTAAPPDLIGPMTYVQQGTPRTTPPIQGRSVHNAPGRNSHGATPAPQAPSVPLMQGENSQEMNPTPSVQSMRTVSQNMGHPEATMGVPAAQAASSASARPSQSRGTSQPMQPQYRDTSRYQDQQSWDLEAAQPSNYGTRTHNQNYGQGHEPSYQNRNRGYNPGHPNYSKEYSDSSTDQTPDNPIRNMTDGEQYDYYMLLDTA